MYRRSITRLTARRPLVARVPLRYSSGSPTAGNKPPDHFTKTGEKAQDPAELNMRGYEYSQSGGDDMVAAQESASFDHAGGNNDPAASRERAGKGNAVNPLDFSPASPELSKMLEDTDVSKGEERDASQHTGQGISRKAKTVPKSGVDYRE